MMGLLDNNWKTIKEKVYGKQIECKGCKKPLVAKVLLDVYNEGLVSRPHFELVCENCGYGTVIK